MDVQQRYWQEFVDLKRDALYVELYLQRTEQTDRLLSGFSALTSSSAVAGWVLWRETVTAFGLHLDLRFIWAFVIMLAQVVSATKEYLPYKRRLHALFGLSSDLNALALTMEDDWFKVSRLMLTQTAIHELQMRMKRRILESRQKNFAGMTLPDQKRLRERADVDTTGYLRSFFGKS